jgi:hypothetical protein
MGSPCNTIQALPPRSTVTVRGVSWDRISTNNATACATFSAGEGALGVGSRRLDAWFHRRVAEPQGYSFKVQLQKIGKAPRCCCSTSRSTERPPGGWGGGGPYGHFTCDITAQLPLQNPHFTPIQNPSVSATFGCGPDIEPEATSPRPPRPGMRKRMAPLQM